MHRARGWAWGCGTPCGQTEPRERLSGHGQAGPVGGWETLGRQQNGETGHGLQLLQGIMMPFQGRRVAYVSNEVSGHRSPGRQASSPPEGMEKTPEPSRLLCHQTAL